MFRDKGILKVPVLGVLLVVFALTAFGLAACGESEPTVIEKEVIKEIEVPVEVMVEKEVIKEVEVPVEVMVEKEVTVEVEVIREVEVPVEVIVEVENDAPGLRKLNVSADMVRGHNNPQGPSCALSSIYQRGEMVVWRAKLVDPATGLHLPADTPGLLASPPTDDEMAALVAGYTVEIRLEDGQVFPMHFGGHGRPDPLDFFWTYGWDIPLDYPTGSISYTIEAVDGNGRTGLFNPTEISVSKLTIAERSEVELVVSADMVRGHTALGGPSCALNSRFPRGELVVWRARIFDAELGNDLPSDAADLLAMEVPPTRDEAAALAEGLTVTVHMSDGQTFPMHYGPHGGAIPLDYFWTVGWEVPADYPTGQLDYTITVEWADQQKSGEWIPPDIGVSKLTIEEAIEEATTQ